MSDKTIRWTLSKVEPVDIWDHAVRATENSLMRYFNYSNQADDYDHHEVRYYVYIRNRNHPVVEYLKRNQIGQESRNGGWYIDFCHIISAEHPFYNTKIIKARTLAINEFENILGAYGDIHADSSC